MALGPDQYLQEGIEQARTARNSIGLGWKDSWLNYATQYALNRQANDQEIAMWKMMNEYNSPANQMQRFKEAGLNPMLAYTQGTPGNASSAPNVHVPDVKMTPHQDTLNQIQMANSIIGMVSNLAQNVMGIFNAGYDTQIKRNEAAWSNLDYAAGVRQIVGFGQGRDVTPGYRVIQSVGPNGEIRNSIPDHLNPFSENFSPLEYRVLSRLGKIPDYFRGYMLTEPQSELTGYKADYQQWYNEHLAPLFERYQSGKATSSEVQSALDQYNLKATEMLPPELRGILQPVVQYLSPFLKFIFKSSKFKVSR